MSSWYIYLLQYWTENTLILILAGVDTVGNSLLYTLWLISQDQRVQTKLRQEIQFLTDDELLHKDKTKYLKACVQETFRMFPTASQIARLTEEPTTLKNGYKLPKSSLVLCHTHVAGRQLENFTSADQFLPGKYTKIGNFELSKFCQTDNHLKKLLRKSIVKK